MIPRPKVQLLHDWEFPTATTYKLSNGIPVWAYHLPGQRVLSLGLVQDIPLAVEADDQQGVANLTLRCLDEGTKTHPDGAFSELLEAQGASLGGSVSQDGTVCSVHFPQRRSAAVLPLFAELLAEPEFAPRDVDRQRETRLTELEQSTQSPPGAAGLGFRAALATDRFGTPAGGWSHTVANLTANQLSDFHATQWGPSRAKLVIAGELPADLPTLLETSLGTWSGAGRPTQPPPIAVDPHRRVWVIDRPDAVQAEIRIGSLGPNRSADDWSALQVAVCALGGSFSSRLNHSLREEHGFTYGAHANLSAFRHTGIFVVQTSCRTEVAAQATELALGLLDLSGAEFTPDETTAAIDYLLGVAPLRYDTAGAITAQASALVLDEVSPTWINDFHHQLATISPQQASAAFQRHFPPGEQHVIVCGKAADLVPDLTALGLSPRLVEVAGDSSPLRFDS